MKERIVTIIVLLVIAVIGIIDILNDYRAGGSIVHMILEGLMVTISVLGSIFIWKKYADVREKNRELQVDIDKIKTESLKWKAESAKFIEGLSKAIDEQLTRWNLTAAEKEVTYLLLKGLSLKEIADIRSTSERTSRQQSLTIYQKSGLAGRAELSAFFLEDLLSPKT